jgi:Ca2+-transporting ATPase
MSKWYQQEIAQVLQDLGTDQSQGLSRKEAETRLSEQGANELKEQPLKSPWKILWEQFTATTVLVLIVAAVVSAILGDFNDAIAIMAIVLFNAALGFVQEYRAGKEFAALRKLAVPQARVYRDGEWQEVSARDLVLGDIVQVEDGDQIPADARLLKSGNLRVQESAFTGESEPVEKTIDPIAGDETSLGDRHNMIYMGTVVTYGRGQAVVTETGMNTELGKIASDIQTIEQEKTPLQRRLDQLGKKLVVFAIVLVLVIFAFGLLRGEKFQLMFLTAVSLAVAIIPEGLPAVVTIALSIGARRMLKRKALIRKLPAVETLGSVTTICSDKTGTLTENRMTVSILNLAGQRVELKEPFTAVKSLLDGKTKTVRFAEGTPLDLPLALTLVGGALCNNAMLKSAAEDSSDKERSKDSSKDSPDEPATSHNSEPPDQAAETKPGAEADTDDQEALGDPTEIALIVAANRMGLPKAELETLFPRSAEASFDSDRKRMSTIHEFQRQGLDQGVGTLLHHLSSLADAPYIAFTKGAVDSLLDVVGQVWHEDHAEPLDDEWSDRIRQGNDDLASNGTRVLGVAFRLLDALPDSGQEGAIEQDLTFVGLVGMLDPARPEARAAVQTCQEAGIRPVMITGDHPLMARHIAEELGISSNGEFLTGQELSKLSIEELEDKIESVSVYARVSPQQKLKIVQALQDQGEIVAMTGDGVNDAPALSKADIGVAMGVAGTDVAKEAADMVLLNDNFATIVSAVEEGRVIYDNIRKFIRYSLTGNTSSVVIMLLAPLFALPLPLTPLQILWINLLADGLLALALSVEPAERNVMRRSPYPPKESVFSRGVGRDIIWVGCLMGTVFLLAGYYYWSIGWQHWQTMVFATLAFSRMSLALAMRSERDLLIKRGLFSNKPMLASVLVTFGLQLAVLYVPWLQHFFQTHALTITELLLCLGISTIGFWAIELEKVILRYHHRKHRKAEIEHST